MLFNSIFILFKLYVDIYLVVNKYVFCSWRTFIVFQYIYFFKIFLRPKLYRLRFILIMSSFGLQILKEIEKFVAICDISLFIFFMLILMFCSVFLSNKTHNRIYKKDIQT